MVRFSGTQPLCRVMVEGPSKEEISKTAKHIAGLIEENIGMT
jgi:Phosphomannomutase